MMFNLIGRDQPFLKNEAYDFRNLNGSYILGYGIMLDRSGSVIWSQNWDHSYSSVYLLEDYGCILTDELHRGGPLGIYAGTYCFELDDGTLRWKHPFSEFMRDIRPVFKDMDCPPNVPWFTVPYTDGDRLISGNVIVDPHSGEYGPRDPGQGYSDLRGYSNLPALTFREIKKNQLDRSPLETLTIPGSEEAFDPHFPVWRKEDKLLVSGKSTQKTGTPDRLLLMIDRQDRQIDRYWSLPIDGYVCDVAPFFDKGLLIHQRTDDRFYLTIIRTEGLP
jgi:hypothetical protein